MDDSSLIFFVNSKLVYILIGLIFCGLYIGCNKKMYNSEMYGIPVKNTGISNLNCNMNCLEGEHSSKMFTSTEIGLMKSYRNTTYSKLIKENPYKSDFIKNSDGVCGVVVEDVKLKLYHLETFNSIEEAEQAGAVITHIDACGACSTLQDLTVYVERLDLGADVRKCAVKNFTKPFDSLLLSLESLGFTKPCAQIWAYNVKNTQAKCFAVCIINNRYNKKNGDLSKCLQCDENKSGPVFKAVAGRTRRNTGIANAICRFCNEVEVLEHNYVLK